MPIKKDQSKDIPGESGYSYNDRKKLLDIAKHPTKYLLYEGDQDDEKESNTAQIIGYVILVIVLSLCVLAAFIGR